MISPESKRVLETIFLRAARSTLIRDPADRIEIEPLPHGKLIEPSEERLLALTISSYRFRLLTLLHYSVNRSTNDYFNGGAERSNFDSAFGEFGNLCCGAMKRDFGNSFMHLGMSTPATLESRCLSFIDVLNPSLVLQYRIDINDSVPLHASLCLCAYDDIHFDASESTAPEATGGLEMFTGTIDFF
jgi:hypothetical protein